MVKVCNKNTFNDVCDNLYSLSGIKIKTENLKNILPFFKKNLKEKNYVDTIYNICKKINLDGLEKKLFPARFEELSNIGEFETKKIYFDTNDSKIHWAVSQNGNTRTFKIRGEDYENKTKDFYNHSLKYLKNEMDKLYGYFFEETNNGWIITDKNIINGEYRKLVYKEDFSVIMNTSSFGMTYSDNDLIFY